MGGLILFLVAVAALVIFDLLAQRYGVDSRPDSDDGRAPTHGIYV
jgi:hypothetical protein